MKMAEGKPAILVVDDEPDLVEYLCVALQDNGFDPIGVSQPEKAVDAALRSPPRAIILDIMMPGRTGYSIYRSLCAAPSLRDVPVFFLSGFPRGGAGAGSPPPPEDLPPPAGFFDKPVDVPALVAALASLPARRLAPGVEGGTP
jgi:CheY-like chemotaxis protein